LGFVLAVDLPLLQDFERGDFRQIQDVSDLKPFCIEIQP